MLAATAKYGKIIMTNLKINTLTFVNEVKAIVDAQNWGYEGWSTSDNGAEKAVNFLDTQKFSLKKIKDALEENWDDILYELRNKKIKGEGKVKFVAGWIAGDLAFERIAKFQFSSVEKDGYKSSKWLIDENVTFNIN